MTLTTHSIIAAAVTNPLTHAHPALVFTAAVASHYLSDAIPHWDYSLYSLQNKEHPDTRSWSNNIRLLIKDLLRIAFDACLGLIVVALLVDPHTLQEWLYVILSAIGGMLPDFLQGCYITFKLPALRPLQRIHDIMHTKIRLGPYPLIGIPFQLLIVTIAMLIVRGFILL